MHPLAVQAHSEGELYRAFPDWRKRWPNFVPQELASGGRETRWLIVPDALDRLQALRKWCGRPLVINSAYRTPVHNASIGGAPWSYHLLGVAFDVSMSGLEEAERDKFIALARTAGFGGIGIYPTFIHIDCGPEREWS